MANTAGEKELKTDYPFEEGITAGTTKLRAKPHLEAEEDLRIMRENEVGM